MFKLISVCTSAKDAWEVLQLHCSPLSNETLVNKVLRTLPERFSMTVTAIEEAKDTSSLRLDELIGSLKYLTGKASETESQGVFLDAATISETLSVTEISELNTDHYTCLNSISLNAAESSNEAVSDEEEMCKKLISNLEKKTQALDAANKENSSLKETITHLEVGITKKDLELAKVKDELKEATLAIKRMNTGTTKLEEIVSLEKYNKKEGLGFKKQVKKQKPVKKKEIVFVKEKGSNGKESRNFTVTTSESRIRGYICHYCFSPGHIRPFCEKLSSDKMLYKMSHITPGNTSKKNVEFTKKECKIWTPKGKLLCKAVYTSLNANISAEDEVDDLIAEGETTEEDTATTDDPDTNSHVSRE
ncbi:PREDICTED: uncharacterized protein LOC105963330 [Erythranthe guttata]|uniref:uncharacterized protein LOC105963330 n=1 Tax=Erythranthe guttata TaxID=4155 RepID=UPI00064DAECD|nr:PREDICTED: uncharacterized protein LOC105963330 [Erythranthe guttata]|eukprot:XP_012843176.1 PREDICTED: uncharacterized protein LOC105963330 [Erythranthe guttata]